MSEKSVQAVEIFQCGYNCSQSVFSVFANDFGLDKDTCLRIASPFGGGIARRQETCGAVSGALMAIGLKYGKGEQGTEEDKKRGYMYSQKFIETFKANHNTISCKELLDGLDMNTPEGMKAIEQAGMFHSRCTEYVKTAVEITESLLSDKL